MDVAEDPLFQEYVPPPDAVSVVLCPEHNAEFPVMDALGAVLKVTVHVAVSGAHNPLDTMTEYVDEAVGVTRITAVEAPLLQA